MGHIRSTGFAVLALLVAGWTGAAAQDAAPGLHEDVVFSAYPPLARNSELLSRVFTPLTLAGIQRDFARTGKTLGEASFDLAAEKFLVYVPPVKPTQGYGLMVFVPPWQKAQLPKRWGPVLDQFGMIFVSAARSGNDEDIISRREPLAVLAALNVMAQYPVDPSRVFVGGMSGGARMALRLALAYPDLFHGALLNSGSDVIGTIYEPCLPPPCSGNSRPGHDYSMSQASRTRPMWSPKPAANARCRIGACPMSAAYACPLPGMKSRPQRF